MVLFTLSETWPIYLAFIFFVIVMLIIDLGIFQKKEHEISFKEASLWTVFWFIAAIAFNVFFYYYAKGKFEATDMFFEKFGKLPHDMAMGLSIEFLTGYVIEKVLAIDNIFVFALVFSYFKIPKIYQHRILFWGILGAIFFRAVFISIGAQLVQYKSVVLIFGIFLIFTGLKLLFKKDDEATLEENFLIRFLSRVFKLKNSITSKNFFVRENGVLYMTPLFLALVFIEFSDLVFAIDSVPAIFSITNEPLLVFTSNMFAILGLRSMYFMLIGVLNKFAYIKYAMSGILVFVGVKMSFLNELYGGKFPVTYSLGIIFLMIVASIVASIYKPVKVHNVHK